MIQIQLISSVIAVERKLAFEEDRMVRRRFDPYVSFLAAPQLLHKERNQQRENTAPADFISARNSNLNR